MSTVKREPRILIDDEVWVELKRLAARKRRGPALVVVPYLTRDLLDLRPGDTLAVDLSPHTLGTGLTDPRVLRRYSRKGVALNRAPGVHAKMYVLGDTAAVGSANMSRSSERELREAMVLLRGKTVVTAVADAAALLVGASITDDDLDAAQELYRPPPARPRQPRRPTRRDPAGPPPQDGDRLWLIGLWPEEWPTTAASRAATLHPALRRRSGRARDVELGSALFDRPAAPDLRVDDLVIEAWADERDGVLTEASYPARVIEVVNVPGPGRSAGWVLVYWRRPTGTSPLPWVDLQGAARRVGARLGDTTSVQRRVTNPRLHLALRKLWHA